MIIRHGLLAILSKKNVHQLQSKIVKPLKNWASQCGTIFRPDKTFMTHFTRNNKIFQPISSFKTLMLNGIAICPSPKLKLLGVILDQKLKFHKHIGSAVKREMTTVLALKRLKNLRPETARRLYNSTVYSR